MERKRKNNGNYDYWEKVEKKKILGNLIKIKIFGKFKVYDGESVDVVGGRGG